MAGELLLSALRQVWAALASLKIDAALMGGVAVAAWRHLRSTRDVDVLVRVDPVAESLFLQRLEAAGMKFRREPPIMRLGESRILQMTFQPPGRFIDVQIDLFFAESEFQRAALERRVAAPLAGISDPVFILSCEDLILFKLQAGPMIDRADAAYLLRFNRDELDFAYLKTWADRLQLTAEFEEVMREAAGESEDQPLR